MRSENRPSMARKFLPWVLLLGILVSILSTESIPTVRAKEVTISPLGYTLGDNNSYYPSISADGRYVAFVSLASNLVSGDTNGYYDVFLRDIQNEVTTRVSISTSGVQGNGDSGFLSLSYGPSISADGRYIAFWSYASNLVPGDTNGVSDVFLYDTKNHITSRVSIDSNGVQGNSWSYESSISANGRYVAFMSLANNLVTTDNNGVYDVFVRDIQENTTKLISVNSDGIQGDAFSDSGISISADGRYVTFASTATNLVNLDTNSMFDVFFRDTQINTTTRISINSTELQANNSSDMPMSSADGRYVVFRSSADNLVSGDTNNEPDIFLRDMLMGVTTRVSVTSSGAQSNSLSQYPAISADGRFIAFESTASNIVSGDMFFTMDVFLRDMQNLTTKLVSIDSNGIRGNEWSAKPTVSADGRFIAFESDATNLVEGDTNGARDIFIHDFQSGNTSLVSISSSKPPLPVIIVHGWQGGATFDGDPNTNGYTCDGIEMYPNRESTLQPNFADPDFKDYSHLAEWLDNDGYQVWIAHLESKPSHTNTLEQNADCLRQQIQTVWNSNPQGITIIAHSMGGLVSRAAIRSLPSEVKVKSLYTLGSPHAGIPLQTIGRFIGVDIRYYCILQPAVCQMSPEYTALFNLVNPNKEGVQYTFIGGDGGSGPMSWALLSTLQGPNDGLVGQYSAVGWYYPIKVSIPTNWSNSAKRYFTNETHPALSSTNLAYYVAPDMAVSQSYQCIKGLMQNPPNEVSCSSPSGNSFRTQEDAVTSLSNVDPYVFSETHTGNLVAAAATSHSIIIDSSGETTFFINWNGGVTPTITLTRPDTVVIDKAYEIANPTEVTYEEGAGTAESAPYQAFTFPVTQTGVWQVNITAGSDLIEYQVFAMMESNRVLDVQTDKDVYTIGDNAVITATLAQNTTPITGATINATLTLQDSSNAVVPLIDPENDGTYIGSYNIPNKPGYFTIDVNANGNDNGVPFTRNITLISAIASNNLQLTGNYDDQPRDEGIDGIYDYLDFTMEVNLTEAGEYAVSAELYSGDQLITQSGNFFTLNSGTQTITLPFYGKDINRSELNGPYSVKNLYLTPLNIGITAANVETVWTTEPYLYSQFTDGIAPEVSSITRASTSPTSASSVDFTVTFSESVQNVDTSDFTLTTTGVSGASITNVTGSGSTRTVTVNTGSGNGTIRLDVPNTATISDLSSNSLSGLPFTSGEVYTINKMPTSATFGDVPMSHPYWEDIEILYANGFTAGCSASPLLFCPEATMNRGESAVFMLRGNFGASYSPPNPPYSPIFVDNWASGPWAQKWAQGMLAEGLTAGCSTSPLLYCPWEQMPRLQAAVFGMRLKEGNAYNPPAATGTVFADITDPSLWYAKWAEAAYNSGILPACGMQGGKPLFCPNQLVSRGLGAYMIVRARNLTMP